MRFEPGLPIAAVSAWFPPRRQSAAEAVAAGLLAAETAAKEGYGAVTVSESSAPPEMAVLAAGAALAEADWDPATVDLLLHAWTYYQGHDFWSAPHFVAHEVGAVRASPVGIQQMCNGGAAAVELAAARLLADPAVARAVVTTADRFEPPGFDRWSGDSGACYGDSATALLLARPGVTAPLLLRSVVTDAAPRFESMHRGDDPFGTAPHALWPQVDGRRTVRQFMAAGRGPDFEAFASTVVPALLSTALAEADSAPDDPRLRFVALPRLGRTVLEVDYRADMFDGITVLRPGHDTGHLGPGDAAASLAEYRHLLRPGDLGVLFSVGAGFTWSALVVEAA